MNETMLSQLDAVLSKKFKKLYMRLHGGVTPDALRAADSRLGFALPEPLRALYQWKNGTDHDEPFFHGMQLCPLAEMIEHYGRLSARFGGRATERWSPGWIPFGYEPTDQGVYLLFDTEGSFRGVPGQILRYGIGDDDLTIECASVEEWLSMVHSVATSGTSPDGASERFDERYEQAQQSLCPGYPKWVYFEVERFGERLRSGADVTLEIVTAAEKDNRGVMRDAIVDLLYGNRIPPKCAFEIACAAGRHLLQKSRTLPWDHKKDAKATQVTYHDAAAQFFRCALWRMPDGRDEVGTIYRREAAENGDSPAGFYALYKLGTLWGSTPEGVEMLRAAIALQARLPTRSPVAKDTYACVDLAVALADLGELTQAETLLRDILSKGDDAGPLKDLGDVLSLQGRHEHALKSYRRAVQEDAEWLGAHTALACCFRRLGRDAEALGVVQKARRKLKDIDAELSEIACLESAARDKARTLRTLAAAVRADPPLAAELYRDLDLEWLRGDPDFERIMNRSR